MGQQNGHLQTPDPGKVDPCQGCFSPLGSEFDVCGPKGLRFCLPCREHRAYCQTCQAPVGGSLFLSGRSICCRCFQDLPRCDACGREGSEVMRDSRFVEGLRVCPDCVDAAMGQCSFCEEVALIDEQGVCRRCHDHLAQKFPDRLSSIIAEVERFLEEAFGMGLLRRYTLQLVGHIPVPPYFTTAVIVRGDFCVMDGRPRIRLREDLREAEFMAVFAHEYTHAWQAENCPPQSRDLLEGFARWVQRKVLFELYEDGESSALERDTREDYGPGLRACLAWEKRLGEKGLIRQVREWTHFPPLSAR